MSVDIDETWDRIEAWLSRYNPDVYESLNPPATLIDIRKTQIFIDAHLPDDVVQSYMRHNGQAETHTLKDEMQLNCLEYLIRSRDAET